MGYKHPSATNKGQGCGVVYNIDHKRVVEISKYSPKKTLLPSIIGGDSIFEVRYQMQKQKKSPRPMPAQALNIGVINPSSSKIEEEPSAAEDFMPEALDEKDNLDIGYEWGAGNYFSAQLTPTCKKSDEKVLNKTQGFDMINVKDGEEEEEDEFEEESKNDQGFLYSIKGYFNSVKKSLAQKFTNNKVIDEEPVKN